jgi:hypothetical protein
MFACGPVLQVICDSLPSSEAPKVEQCDSKVQYQMRDPSAQRNLEYVGVRGGLNVRAGRMKASRVCLGRKITGKEIKGTHKLPTYKK